jgi:hypothetical protein
VDKSLLGTRYPGFAPGVWLFLRSLTACCQNESSGCLSIYSIVASFIPRAEDNGVACQAMQGENVRRSYKLFQNKPGWRWLRWGIEVPGTNNAIVETQKRPIQLSPLRLSCQPVPRVRTKIGKSVQHLFAKAPGDTICQG